MLYVNYVSAVNSKKFHRIYQKMAEVTLGLARTREMETAEEMGEPALALVAEIATAQ